MKREAGQRAYLVIGSPWLTAITAIRDRNSKEDPWQVRGSFQPGDLLVTVLDTDPRAVLCVERLEQGGPHDEPVVLGERCMTAGLPTVAGVEDRAQAKLPKAPGRIPDHDADRLLDAIAIVHWETSYNARAANHVGPAEAWVRLNAVPMCLLCDQYVEPGDPAASVYVGQAPGAGASIDGISHVEDVDGLMCARCSEEMASSPNATLVEHRLATRHPQCPRCAAFRTRSFAFGKLQLPPELAPRWPWEVATGDVVDGTEAQWNCSACGYAWEYRFPDLDPFVSNRQRVVVPVWERNVDNRIVIARKQGDSGRFIPTSVLCAPLEPIEVMQVLAEIVATTFAGNWDAALTVIEDRSVSAWEFLDVAVNEFSESIGDRAREVLYGGTPQFVAVAGVGMTTDYGPYNTEETGVGEYSADFYDVAYGFVIDGGGNAEVLAAQIEHEVVQDGKIMVEEEEVWTYLYTLAPDDYRPDGAR
ncbi:hypothetical protein [Rhodococcoides fascians]|uniref:hypothetical protein n=1 Tax=Rhodococcoides fascians TaxID=1828 RepID=UPI00114038AA|nr:MULTISPECIES: hypothetical protein [Rhodococcus]